MTSGRLKKTMDDLWEGWQEDILELYTEGASDVEIKALIYQKSENCNCSNDLWARWITDEPIFSETITRGKALSAAWWEKHGRSNLYDLKFNHRLWDINMRNRFKWGNDNGVPEAPPEELRPEEFL